MESVFNVYKCFFTKNDNYNFERYDAWVKGDNEENFITINDKYNDWPVIYTIKNDKSNLLYIGSTRNIIQRLNEHYSSEDKKQLKDGEVYIIFPKFSNMSLVMNVESQLINYVPLGTKYALLNKLDVLLDSSYYRKNEYEKNFLSKVWDYFCEEKIVRNNFEELSKKGLFKYSPYKKLDKYQQKITVELIKNINKNGNNINFVCGGAGTGKTILAMYLAYFFSPNNKMMLQKFMDHDSQIKLIKKSKKFLKDNHKIGIVLPMDNINKSVSDVIELLGIQKYVEVIKPFEYIKKTFNIKTDSNKEVIGKEKYSTIYDLVIIDEAQKLFLNEFASGQCKKLYQEYTNVLNDLCDNEKIKLPVYKSEIDNVAYTTQLDWFIKISKDLNTKLLVFYDETQRTKDHCINLNNYKGVYSDEVNELVKKAKKLHVQHRCLGGNTYMNFIKDVLYNPSKKVEIKSIKNYEFKVVDDLNKLGNLIEKKRKDAQTDINARILSGLGYEWKSKKNNSINDFRQIGKKWNDKNYSNWAYKKEKEDEVGCIFSISGADLDFAGVIFGKEIDFDPVNNKYIINKDEYTDRNAKYLLGKSTKQEEDERILQYALNSYYVLLTRGMFGTYVFVENENLRNHFKEIGILR